MKTTTLQKMLAASALAVLLMPAAASAHGLGLSVGSGLNFGFNGDKNKSHVEGNGTLKANAKFGDRNDYKNHDKWDKVKATASATTTAAVVTKKANRIKDVADFMGSIGTTIEAKIASLGTTTPAVTTATADYKTQLASAKTQAQAAVTTSATLTATNSTTTNASIVAQAQAQLKAARDFLAAARADLMVMLHFLWK